jgi:hypothetical protein
MEIHREEDGNVADEGKSERETENPDMENPEARNQEQRPDLPNHQLKTLIIAHVRAHLVTGEAFDLLPIKHEQNVKNEVNALIESWAQSGFLLRGRFIYPWHQVKQIEVTSVEELPLRLAYQRLEDLYAAERARTQEDFWRTKVRSDRGSGRGEHEGNKKAGAKNSHEAG